MKSDKELKYTGIIQGVLIGILLLTAILINIASITHFYSNNYSLNDIPTFWTIQGDYPILFIVQTVFTFAASLSNLFYNYILYAVFEFLSLAALALPVYLAYKSIRRQSTTANGLIIVSSAITLLLMFAFGLRGLFDIIYHSTVFNIYSLLYIIMMLIKAVLIFISVRRIKAIDNSY